MKGSSHSKAQIDIINKHIVQYNRKRVAHVNLYDENSKEINDDFFDVLMAEDGITHNRRIIDAFERAKAIHKSKLTNGAEYRESVTTIYEVSMMKFSFFYI